MILKYAGKLEHFSMTPKICFNRKSMCCTNTITNLRDNLKQEREFIQLGRLRKLHVLQFLQTLKASNVVQAYILVFCTLYFLIIVTTHRQDPLVGRTHISLDENT